ncbi:pseudoazurin [Ruegeria jejuensis]|uniref:pseudoazurin n=1 Tax=Ruegeria jejuensis TaxID=3233338 RepID=UPI00355C38FD
MRLLVALIVSILPSVALAELHEVEMLNRDETGSMVYAPSYLKIAPGDTVKFLATRPGHNAASIDGMVPGGAEPFKGKINEEIEVTFTVPGIYGIKCTPHYAMGMVMLIQVGDGPATPDTLPDDLPKRAKDRLLSYISAQPQ